MLSRPSVRLRQNASRSGACGYRPASPMTATALASAAGAACGAAGRTCGTRSGSPYSTAKLSWVPLSPRASTSRPTAAGIGTIPVDAAERIPGVRRRGRRAVGRGHVGDHVPHVAAPLPPPLDATAQRVVTGPAAGEDQPRVVPVDEVVGEYPGERPGATGDEVHP